jgi:hypothetical protein
VQVDALALSDGAAIDADDFSGQQALPEKGTTILDSELLHGATLGFYSKVHIV